MKLKEVIEQLEHLTALNLSGDLSIQEMRTLAKLLKDNRCISSLDLGSNQLGLPGAQVLADIFKYNETLTSLDLYANQIGDKGAKILADALKHNYKLCSLILIKNQIGTTGAQALAEFLKYNHTLTFLDLTDNRIDASGAYAFSEALKVNKGLGKFNLSDNKIGDKGAQALARSLGSNQVLSFLDVSNNQIGSSGGRAFGKALEKNRSLTCLELQNNEIMDIGVQNLVVMLKSNHVFSSLNLSNNKVTDLGGQVLAAVLRKNHALISLDLSYNKLGDRCALNLIEMLKYNQALSSFKLSNNSMSIPVYEQYKAAWSNHGKQQNELIIAARTGDETKLKVNFSSFKVFPPFVLSLLTKCKHEALIVKWQNMWSIAGVNYRDESDNTPLHLAINNKMEEVIAWLLTQPASLVMRNADNQSSLALLEELTTTNSSWKFRLGYHHFFGHGIEINREKGLNYYSEAMGEKVNNLFSILLLLVDYIDQQSPLESLTNEKIEALQQAIAVLKPEEVVMFIKALATPKVNLPHSLTKQGYTFYHLSALLGSIELLKGLQDLAEEKNSGLYLSPLLVFQEDKDGLRPHILAYQQACSITKEKGYSLSSSRAAQDPILQRYRLCEKLLRQAEEKVELALLLADERKHLSIKIDSENKDQVLKEHFAQIEWHPKGIKKNLVIKYKQILEEVWRIKQQFITLHHHSTGTLIWPQGFDPFKLVSPGQTLQGLQQEFSSGFLAFRASWSSGSGLSVYVEHYIKQLIDYSEAYTKNNQNVRNEYYEQGKQAFKQLSKIYKQYENLCKSVKKEQHWFLLSSPVLLLRPSNESIFIASSKDDSSSIADKLVYPLNKGERVIGVIGTGSSPVIPLGNIHYKRNPHAPGIASMISSLQKILTAKKVIPDQLLKVIDQEGKAYTYQVSHKVQGKELQSLLLYYPEWVEKICPDSFAMMVILGILTDPQDGKPDNYNLVYHQDIQGNIIKIDIIGLDNDLAFSNVMITHHKRGEKVNQSIMNIKNVLYFFPQMMKPIAANFRDKLLSQLPELVLLNWLLELLDKNNHYEALLKEGIFTIEEYEGDKQTNTPSLQLPIKVAPDMILELYRKLRQMYELLLEQPTITLWELLMATEPEVATYYAEVKQRYPHELLGCDVIRCMTSLYEENLLNEKELTWFHTRLDAGYTYTMTSVILETIKEFGFEENRTTSLTDSLIKVLGCLKYEVFKGELAPLLYHALKVIIEVAKLEELLPLAISHQYSDCVYWLWQESLIERLEIQEACEKTWRYSLLHFFVQNRHLEAIKYLVNEGVYSVNISNGQGYTPLHIAASIGDKVIVEYLIQQGAYVMAKTTLHKTALMMAEKRCEEMNKQVPQSGDEKYADTITYLKDNKSDSPVYHSVTLNRKPFFDSSSISSHSCSSLSKMNKP